MDPDAWVSAFETFLDEYGWPTVIVFALWRGWLVIGTEAREWKNIAKRAIETNERLVAAGERLADRRREDVPVDDDRRARTEAK